MFAKFIAVSILLWMENFLPDSEHLIQLKLSGPDAVDFTHRMFSRDVKNLPAGEGRLSLLLSAEGKITALFWLLKESPTDLVLLVDHRLEKRLTEAIEHFHFAEKFDVASLGPVSARYRTQPPEGLAEGASAKSGSLWHACWRGIGFEFDLQAQPTHGDLDSWISTRLHHLLPSYSCEWDENSLVFDIAGEKLCDLKGCFSGQEVVERVRSRGGAGPRKLARVRFDGEAPRDPEAVLMNEKGEPIGSLADTRSGSLSLGFVRRGIGAGLSITSGASKGQVDALID